MGRESPDMGLESQDVPKCGRESLDMGRDSLDIPKFGRESLERCCESQDVPKIGRQSLDMGRKSLDTDFRDTCLDFHDRILVCPDIHGPRSNSCPDVPDSNSRRNYAIWV